MPAQPSTGLGCRRGGPQQQCWVAIRAGISGQDRLTGLEDHAISQRRALVAAGLESLEPELRPGAHDSIHGVPRGV